MAKPSLVALLRRRGFRWVVTSAWQYVRARRALGSATSVGTARLRGKLFLRNYGIARVADRVRFDGTIVPIDLFCGRGAILDIGEGTFLNYGVSIGALTRVTVGRDCDIGQYTLIMDSDFHSTEQHREPGIARPVVIEDDVWIGARVIVLPGAHIGRGAVIGAHSVVRGVIPPRALAVGAPARVVRHLDTPRPQLESVAEPAASSG